MNLRWVQNSRWLRRHGIGGEFACPLPQIANGGPKARGGSAGPWVPTGGRRCLAPT